MSDEARPISPASFAKAVEDLPVENLYGKAYEINNSITHLEQSNKLLQEYSDSIKNDQSLDASTRASGDQDCLDAIKENAIVIERQHERLRLLKAEVERRGQRWHEVDPKAKEETSNGQDEGNGDTNNAPTTASLPPSRLSDEELRRQLEERLAQEGGEEEGVHL